MLVVDKQKRISCFVEPKLPFTSIYIMIILIFTVEILNIKTVCAVCTTTCQGKVKRKFEFPLEKVLFLFSLLCLIISHLKRFNVGAKWKMRFHFPTFHFTLLAVNDTRHSTLGRQSLVFERLVCVYYVRPYLNN